MIRRRKLGSAFRAVLRFTEEEWAAFDPDATPVTAAIKQGDLRHPLSVSIDAAAHRITLELETSSLQPGRAVFDVWIGDDPIPAESNIVFEFFRGASR